MKNKVDKLYFFIGIIIFAISIILQFIFAFSSDIWVDEAFSIKMIEHSYIEMINLTAIDVHPPLYYIMLKFFCGIVTGIFGNVSIITVSKIFSIIPYIILPIILYIKLQNKFKKHSIYFIIISIVPLISYGVEIRMYSWAMLFVVSAFIYLNEIIHEGNNKDWVIFTIMGILASYTHYFACVSVVFVYVSLLIWGLLKDKKIIKKWFCCVLISIVAYLPWLFIFINQFFKVSESYWIPKITIYTIIDYFKFYHFYSKLLLLCSMIICLFFVKKIIKEKKIDNGTFYVISGLVVLIGTIFVGTIISIIDRPIFVSRYMIPAIPCFWMGIIISTDIKKFKYLRYILTFLLVITCIKSCYNFSVLEFESSNKYNKAISALSNNEKTIYVSDNTHVQRVIAISVKNAGSYVYNLETSNLTKNVYGNLDSIYSVEEIKNLVELGYTVYFLQQDDTVSICKLFDENNINYEYIGDYFLEYNIKAYVITK